MRSEGSPGARGLVSALVLAIVGLAIAWICVRTTVVGLMPSNAPAVMKLAPGSASAALGRATTALGRNHGLLGGPRRQLDAAPTLQRAGRGGRGQSRGRVSPASNALRAVTIELEVE